MEKNIWIISSNKKELVETQGAVNGGGTFRTIAMLSHQSVEKAIEREDIDIRPSVIILDYDTEKECGFKALEIIQGQSAYVGVPVIFIIGKRTKEIDEECYERGALIVLSKPLSNVALMRIKRIASQYEKGRDYEIILQRQNSELSMARQIKILNEQLEKRNELLYQIFGRYFSNDITEVILDNPEGASIGGEKKNVTILMADLRSFTPIAERLEADSLTDMINFFLGEMTEIIFKWKGSIIEFIGDAILAVFGAPMELECSEYNALKAALEMQEAMSKVNEYNSENGYPELKMGIGINKGEVFIGNIGSNRMMRYNVMGNTVNLASRIEDVSKGGQILISKESIKDIEKKVAVREEITVTVKGISKEVTVCEVMGIE